MAATSNSVIDKRARFHQSFVWEDADGNAISTAGYTVSMVFRRTPLGPALLTLTNQDDEHGDLEVEESEDGSTDVNISSEVTGALVGHLAWYALTLTLAEEVQRLIQGWYYLSPNGPDDA